MKAILFDLDDTLYPEIEFVKSGFLAVARFLSERYKLDSDDLLKEMLQTLEVEGRGKIFDRLLQKLDLYSEERVRLLVYLYRSHRPTINLYSDVMPLLKKLSDKMLLGMVTDGMAIVQQNKVSALRLEKLMNTIVYPDELGQDFWKPSPLPFKVALELLDTSPSEAAYVGNDPVKDFTGPNSIGMTTIHLDRIYDKSPKPKSAAKVTVKGFKELLKVAERY